MKVGVRGLATQAVVVQTLRALDPLTVNIPNTLVGKFVDFALAFSAYICGPLAREGAFQGQKVRWVSG